MCHMLHVDFGSWCQFASKEKKERKKGREERA